MRHNILVLNYNGLIGGLMMSFEPNYEKIVSNYKKKIGEMQSQIECRLPISNVADKVLCNNVNVDIVSTSVSGNAINIEGSALTQVIYRDADGGYNTIDYTLEFKDKYLASSDINTNDIIVCSDVIDITSAIDGSAIKVVAVVNMCIYGIMSENINVLISADGAGLYTRYEDMEYSRLVGVATDNFDTTYDITIKDAVDRILSVCPNTYIDRVEANDGYIEVYGVADITVNYLTAGDNPQPRTYNNRYDFSQEVALNGVLRDSVVMSEVTPNYSSIRVETDIQPDATAVNITMPVSYKGYVWNSKSMQIVSDIYSTTHYIRVNTEAFTVSDNQPAVTYNERISGSMVIEENDPLIDEILGVCGARVAIASVRHSSDVVTFDGIATATVMYASSETNGTVSQIVDLPFSVDVKRDGVADTTLIHVNASVVGMSAKARRGTEIELSGELILNVTYSNLSQDAVIDSVQIDDEKPPVDCGLIIYIAREGDTIWDIAKEMSVSEETILEQNPNLTLPIEAGTRIVVYRQLIADVQ